jgi:hypothetical protein
MTDSPDKSLIIDTHHHILPDGNRRRTRMPPSAENCIDQGCSLY